MNKEDILKELEAMANNWQIRYKEAEDNAQIAKATSRAQMYHQLTGYVSAMDDNIDDLQQLITKIKEQ